MRIVIETDESGQVRVESQGQTESEQELGYIDGGGPSEELLAALDETVSESSEFNVTESDAVTEETEDSTFH